MTKSHVKRPVAVAAAVALAFGGGLFASPAMAETPAATSGPSYEKQAKDLLDNEEVQAVGRDGNGQIVVLKTEDTKESEELKTFSKKHSNVVVEEIDSPFEAYGPRDVVGGAGYLAAEGEPVGTVGLCSTAFTATAPDGGQAVLTAGHCHASGQDQTYLSLPSLDAADGNEVAPNGTGLLGEFVFSQYGMPDGDDSSGEGSVDALDVAVIDVREGGGFETLPEVTDWSTANQDDLAASTFDVRGVTDVTEGHVGNTALKSGRTTGVSEGEIDVVDGWAAVSGEYVYGFGAFMEATQGDSGGAVMIGDQAAGIVSGGGEKDGEQYMWAAELQNSLDHLPEGYEINTVSATPAPNPSETETDEPTSPAPDPTETETDEPTSPAPNPSETETEEPTSPAPNPTGTETDEPTSPAPNPSETETDESTVEPGLRVDPERIAASDFVNEDEGVSYYAEGLEPGANILFETFMNGELAKTTELTVDENGEAAAKVWGLDPESKDAYIGTYAVKVTSESASADSTVSAAAQVVLEGSFEVVADEEVANPGGDDDENNGEEGSDLPRTGMEMTGLATGAVLLAVGVVAVLLAGRRFALKK